MEEESAIQAQKKAKQDEIDRIKLAELQAQNSKL